MPEPEARMAAAAAGHCRLQASHADREQAIEMLKAAFVQDRLTKEEFDLRVGQAFTARTNAQMAALTADLPAGLIMAERLRKPVRRAQGRVSVNKAVTGGACLVIAVHMGMLAALLTGSGAVLLLVVVFAIIGAAVAIWALIVAS